MASPELLKILKKGVAAWNTWRKENPNRGGRANLKGADLRGANLSGVDFGGVNLIDAYLHNANLSAADLSNSTLCRAKLVGADLRHANLRDAYLVKVDFRRANLSNADLRGAIFAEVLGEDGPSVYGAIMKGIRITSESESRGSRGFVEFATAWGLETVDFGDEEFLADYLARAFTWAHEHGWAHEYDRPREPGKYIFMDAVFATISYLRKLFPDLPPPAELITVVRTISAELIKYLQARPYELYQIRARQFEQLIAEILASYGWEVQLTSVTRDGGYDVYAITREKPSETTPWLIECKRYAPDRKVGINIVRALYGTKVLLGKHNANLMLATTSHFTKSVHDLKASRYDLHLRDYEGIIEWINEYRPNPNGRLYIRENRLIIQGEE